MIRLGIVLNEVAGRARMRAFAAEQIFDLWARLTLVRPSLSGLGCAWGSAGGNIFSTATRRRAGRPSAQRINQVLADVTTALRHLIQGLPHCRARLRIERSSALHDKHLVPHAVQKETLYDVLACVEAPPPDEAS